jgi:hypothetical protein
VAHALLRAAFTRVNAFGHAPKRCSHECEHGTLKRAPRQAALRFLGLFSARLRRDATRMKQVKLDRLFASRHLQPSLSTLLRPMNTSLIRIV